MITVEKELASIIVETLWFTRDIGQKRKKKWSKKRDPVSLYPFIWIEIVTEFILTTTDCIIEKRGGGGGQQKEPEFENVLVIL